MFKEFIDEQEISAKILINAIKNNKLSHAYIIETNNYNKADDFALSFIKYIVCPKSIEDNHNENECNICASINNNNFIELKIIDSDTLQIKKDEIIDLQKEFMCKAIEGNKKIYLIKNAEKLNSSSSNTILKFLEEPEDNIIAILMTSSRYNLLKTIVSRCQIISLKENQITENIFNKIYREYFYNDELTEEIDKKIKNMIQNVLKFVENYEKNIKDSLLFTSEYYSNNFKTREDSLIVFEIIKLLYYDALKYKIEGNLYYFSEYKNDIKFISNNNNPNTIAKKLEIIMKYIEKIKFNVNTNLLIDKYLMELGGIYD